MVTVVHLVNGLPLGGVAFLVDGSGMKLPRTIKSRRATDKGAAQVLTSALRSSGAGAVRRVADYGRR
jgi:hypothetical protein